jgi:Ca2+-binding RTX toxin-like protein
MSILYQLGEQKMNTPLIQEFIKIRKGAVLALGVLLASLFMVGTASAAVTNVSLSSGVLTIVCDNANDTVQFQQWGGTAGQPLTYNTRVGVGPNVNGYNLLATWSGQNGVPVSGGTITGVRKVVIMGGGGDDNLSVNTTTPAGTVIELFGEAGNDTLSGGNKTNELLVGGAGDDTLNGGNGNDTLYGDAKRRAKLSRVLGKRALKSFHPRLFNDRLFAGETWSDKNGCHTRNQATAFC